MEKKTITGIAGQEDSYLGRHLLVEFHYIHEIIHISPKFNCDHIEQIYFDKLTRCASQHLVRIYRIFVLRSIYEHPISYNHY